MVKLNPQILTKDGKNEFVVLPYEEYLLLKDRLEDLEDLLDLRKAKREEMDAATVSFEEVNKQFKR